MSLKTVEEILSNFPERVASLEEKKTAHAKEEKHEYKKEKESGGDEDDEEWVISPPDYLQKITILPNEEKVVSTQPELKALDPDLVWELEKKNRKNRKKR